MRRPMGAVVVLGSIAMLDYINEPKIMLENQRVSFFARCISRTARLMEIAGTNPFEESRGVPAPSGADALRPSPGAAFFSQIQEREVRRTALSRGGRGAKESRKQSHPTTRITARFDQTKPNCAGKH